MARIGVTLSGSERKLLNRLAEAEAQVTLHELRLAAAKKILAPKDSPSTFMALSGLQSQFNLVTSTLSNVTAAGSMVGAIKTTVGQIGDQLDLIRETLADPDSNLDAAHREAAQAKIDEAINKINELAGTSINNRRVLDGSADYRISGGDVSQVRSLRVYSTGSVEPLRSVPKTISGDVAKAATQAQLVYTGSGGQATAAAQFTLTGKRGSAAISVSLNEDLDDVAEKINEVSHTTGVVASVDNDELTLTSVDYGTAAKVAVAVTSGAFAVKGGNGDGTANGTDAVARINGITYNNTPVAQPAELRHYEATGLIANNATIRITGELGSADVALVAGQSLTTAAGNINAQSDFTGIRATVDGKNLVLESTQVGTEAQARVEVLTGTFDTLDGYTADTPAELVYTGSGGKLTDAASFRLTGTNFHNFTFADDTALTDVRDTINAEIGTTGVQAVVDGDHLYLRSVQTGEAASVAVSNVVGSFPVTGGDGEGTAYGANAFAVAEGQDAGIPGVDGNRFTINDNGFHYEIEFAAGFAGAFDTMAVDGGGLAFALSTQANRRSTLALPSLFAESLGGLSGRLSQIFSGEAYSGLDGNTSRAIRIVDEATGQLDKVQGQVDGFYDATITSSSQLLTKLQDDLETSIQQTDGYNKDEEETLLENSRELVSNAQAGLSMLYDQRMAIVRLIQHIAGLD